VVAHYSLGDETDRLVGRGSSRIEFSRAKELLERFLSEPPARILDVGGGPGLVRVMAGRRGSTSAEAWGSSRNLGAGHESPPRDSDARVPLGGRS
jgi:hypothetical protein